MTITSSVGLVSGLQTGQIIDSLMAIEARPKDLLTQRNTTLQAQEAALQAISAKLLAVKLNADALVKDSLFNKTTATTSNESVLTASSDDTALPGNYAFTVHQLASGQQSITQGFSDPTATIGTGTLSFDRGDARLDSHTHLSDLNGGAGVTRGKIRITDRSGASTVVDLSTAVTVDDVVNAINSASGISVVAGVEGDHLILTDNTGQTTANLAVANVGTTGTAAALGLAGSVAADTLAGSQVNRIGEDTQLGALNNGNGIRNIDGVDDFSITSGDGTSYNVNLDGATTVGDVIDAINTATGGQVTAAIAGDGVSLQLTDAAGGGTGFTVAAINGSNSVADLGFTGGDSDGDGTIAGSRLLAGIDSKLLRYLNGGQGLVGSTAMISQLTAGTAMADLFNGSGLNTTGNNLYDMEVRTHAGQTYDFNLDDYNTVGDFIDSVTTRSGGNLTLSITGNRFTLTDNTTGGNNLRVIEPAGAAMTQLGLIADTAAASVTSIDTNPTPQPSGQTGLGTIAVTNRLGTLTQIDLAAAASVSDVLKLINDSNAGVTASLNDAGDGILLTDTTGGGGDLIVADVSGAAATNLHLAGHYAADTVDSGNLDLQYITENTTLAHLGVAKGQFTLTDSTGNSATVDLTQSADKTIGDVISEINSRGLAITASINATGDGILLQDTGPGTVAMTVTESGSTTARDLGLLGTADEAGADIDGTFAKGVDITATDTLNDLADKINAADVGVTASIINDGSNGAPYRLVLSSQDSGSAGAFVLDDGGLDLGATTLAQAQDAVVFYGSSDPAKALAITSSSNTLDTLVPGASIDLHATSDAPVQLTIARDNDSVTQMVSGLVDNFNGVIESLDTYDTYNAETQQAGVLLGDSTVANVRMQLYNTVTRHDDDLTGAYQSLAQIGITIGSNAKLEFDQSKFEAALNADPKAVQALFTLNETTSDPDTGDVTTTAAGLGIKIQNMLDHLTDSNTGIIQNRVDALEQQVKLNNRRIDDLTELLAQKRAQLQQQFNHMEQVLSQLKSQSTSLASLGSLLSSSSASSSASSASSGSS